MEETSQTSSPSSHQRSKISFLILFSLGLLLLWKTPFTKLDSLVLGEPARLQLATSPYLICSIDDDPEDYNAHGIYNPKDLAVTVLNLKRLGITHLFLGTHLHWPDLDEYDNNVLRTQLEKLDSCVLSVPLRRTSAGVDLPAYLQATSVPISEVEGDTRMLPVVNNLSLAPTISIPNNAKIGFSQLETEPPNPNIPLLARWGDQVLLSSLLLERIHQLGGSQSELKIHIGKSIQILSSGIGIPIDEFGYFKPASQPTTTHPHIISSNITNIETPPLPSHTGILTAAGDLADSYRAIDTPASQLALLSVPPTIRQSPIDFLYVAIFLTLLTVLLTVMSHLSPPRYFFWCLLLAGIIILAAASIARSQNHYLPLTPLFGTILLALILFGINAIFGVQREARGSGTAIDFNELASGFTARSYKKKVTKQEAKAASRDRRKERRRKRQEKRRKHKENKENKNSNNDSAK